MTNSSLKTTDDASAAVATAPRVSLADIEAAIAARFDTTGQEALAATINRPDIQGMNALSTETVAALGILSICILVLHNGFTVIGKSAPASPENFNRDLGVKFAYEDAVRQVWPLMGFALRDRLHAGTLAVGNSAI